MSQKPIGWEKAELGAVLSIRNGYAFKTVDFRNEGVPLIKQSNLAGETVDLTKCAFLPSNFLTEYERFQLRKGDILVGMSGSIGKLCLFDKDVTALQNQRTGKVELQSKVDVSERYVWHFLKTIEKQLVEKGKGVAVANVSAADIEGLPFPLAPLPEQKRIADKLDATLARVDACRERLARVSPILKRFRQSVLAAATSGQLTADWRAQQGHSNAGDDDKELQGNTHVDQLNQASPNSANPSENAVGSTDLYSGYPSGWVASTLEQYIAEGPKNGLYKPSTAYGSGTKILRIDNFYDGKVTSFDSLKRLAVSDAEIRQFGLANGDIVINRVNSIEYLGKCALIEGLAEDCVFESNMMKLRTKASLLPGFLKLALCSPAGRVAICANAKHAVNQASINQGDVKNFPILIPTVAEQTEIIRRVDTLFAFADRLEARLASASTAAERLTPSLLAKAFRGELVPQNPNDEPASELLRRLAAQREAAGSKPKRGRKASA